MAAKRVRELLRPVIWIVAGLYFLLDAMSATLLRPIAHWLEKISSTLRITAWVRSLGPYSSLMLFLVPLVILEPVKPISLYLVSTGHAKVGLVVLVLGEALKILILERIFQMTRPKLMSFRLFAWAHHKTTQAFNYFKTMTAVQSVRVWFRRIRARARLLWIYHWAKPASHG